MLTSVSAFFLMSLLTVSMYRNVGLPLDLTPSTTMSSTVMLVWLSSRRLPCPYQRSRFCIRCVAIGWTVAASLISLFLLCSLRLTPCTHRNFFISSLFISISSFFFIVQLSAPCLSLTGTFLSQLLIIIIIVNMISAGESVNYIYILDALQRKYVNCTNHVHVNALDEIYNFINRSIMASSVDYTFSTARIRHNVVPGWNHT